MPAVGDKVRYCSAASGEYDATIRAVRSDATVDIDVYASPSSYVSRTRVIWVEDPAAQGSMIAKPMRAE